MKRVNRPFVNLGIRRVRIAQKTQRTLFPRTPKALRHPHREPAALELIRENKDQLALVLIEPVQSSNPRDDTKEFLQAVAEACWENDVLFLLDEVITGFRIAYGGGQERFGLESETLAPSKTLCSNSVPIATPVGSQLLVCGEFAREVDILRQR